MEVHMHYQIMRRIAVAVALVGGCGDSTADTTEIDGPVYGPSCGETVERVYAACDSVYVDLLSEPDCLLAGPLCFGPWLDCIDATVGSLVGDDYVTGGKAVEVARACAPEPWLDRNAEPCTSDDYGCTQCNLAQQSCED